jgi:hypothetical protein
MLVIPTSLLTDLSGVGVAGHIGTGGHVELSTDDLNDLYADFLARGVVIDVPPHDEPWERAMTAFDPDGYSVEMAQGRRGKKE